MPWEKDKLRQLKLKQYIRHRKKFPKGVEDFAVDKITFCQHTALPKLNPFKTPARNLYNSLNK